ncbi:MAG: cytochrome c [Acidimicrobiia bacterium]|nr:cytochrome c [Acidimicrobiia bacterium]
MDSLNRRGEACLARNVHPYGRRVRRPYIVLAMLMAATVGSVAQAPAPAPPAQPSPATVEEGRKIFASYGCYQCHGYEGQGGAAGPRIAPRPLPYAGLSRYVRRPAGQMPPYTEKILADAHLQKIYAYLQTRPAPKPVDSIPLLSK